MADLQNSYDRVAAEYAARFYNELDGKPLDRTLLDRFAADVGSTGPVCDLGCGPGEIAHFLKDRGVDVFGMDVSPQMLAEGRRCDPRIPFRLGSMLAIEDPDASWAGIAAFYSIVHIPPQQMVTALSEMRRVLKPGGPLLLSFHIVAGGAGAEVEMVHPAEMWGIPIDIDWFFYPTTQIVDNLKTAGFVLEDVIERWPYPDIEYQGKRGYIFARKADQE